MSIENDNKLQLLHRAWPVNAVLTTKALKAKGFSDQLIQRYCQSGWLKRIGVGAYIRQNDKTTWQGGLYAIQHDLNKPIHIGGLSALELNGVGHYLELSAEKTNYIYNTTSAKQNLPGWFTSFFKKNIHYTQCNIFNKEIGLRLQRIERFDLLTSETERAILEVLYHVPKYFSIEHANNLVENLQTIRPDKMQELLENCRHILIKRLFLCLADLCQLPVLKYLEVDKIDLGSGDRSIGTGGKYFSKYKLVLAFNKDLEGDIDV